MPTSAQLGSLRVVTRFAAAIGDARPHWSPTDRRSLKLGFHALRGVQQRLSAGWLDESFRRPIIEQLVEHQADAGAAHSHIPERTRDALRQLCSRLLTDEGIEPLVDALIAFASRLRIDNQYTLALDALLILVDVLEQIDDARIDENRCLAAIIAINANDWDTVDTMISALRASSGHDAPACAWELESRRAFYRGNLPAAEQAARTAVALVDTSSPSMTASWAYHTLGSVVGTQGRHREAAAALFESYRLAPDPVRAQWALASLSVGLFQLGLIDAAADCCALLLRAESANLRGAALMTAIRIAGRRGDVSEIARLRLEVESLFGREILIAHEATQLYYTLGVVLSHVGDAEAARSYWSRGLDVAHSYRIHHVEYLLDLALTTGRTQSDALGPLPIPASPTDSTSDSDQSLTYVELRLRNDRVALELAAQ
jgi:tetratricopeptide (TPR) repeat protein